MCLKSKAPVWGMLMLFSSFIAVAVCGPAILADASRSGRRAGLSALAGLIRSGARSRLLPAAASRLDDAPKHTKVLPHIGRGGRRMMIPAMRVLHALPDGVSHPVLGRLEEDDGRGTSRGEDINLKDESRPRRRSRQLTEDRAERARAGLASARTGSLPAVWAGGSYSVLTILLTLASTGHLSVRPAQMRAFASRRVAQLGWTA